MRILSWNVNGIRAVEKKGFLQWLENESPDILCIQETKASAEQLSRRLIEPAGYTTLWNSAQRKGYSGVAVFTKEDPIAVETNMGIKAFDEEGRFLRVEYKDFILFNLYFPNGKKNRERLQFKLDFYEAFLAGLEELRKKKPHMIFCGDVNTAHSEIDLARPKENEKVSGFLRIERDWLDKVVAKDYVDTFRHFNAGRVQYSWWDQKTRARERNIGWRIDYLFVTRDLINLVKKAFILDDVMGSDHCPIGIELEQGR